jgi:hypothetical protein
MTPPDPPATYAFERIPTAAQDGDRLRVSIFALVEEPNSSTRETLEVHVCWWGAGNEIFDQRFVGSAIRCVVGR